MPIRLFPMAEDQWELCLEEMERIQADRVLLCGGGEFDLPPEEHFREIVAQLKRGKKYFEGHGLEVGYWTSTIGHTAQLSMSGDKARFQEIVGAQGQVTHGCFCPLDKGFREYMRGMFTAVAKSKVGLILLDDDYRLALHGAGGAGCFCELHVKELSQRVGRKLTRDEIVRECLLGEPTALRREWLAMNGELLTEFARDIGEAVHGVSPKTRVGLALVHTLWEGEGVEVRSLLEAFAGKTRPFVRLIGAPYWVGATGRDLGTVTELVRMQQFWLKGFDAEVLVEGDTWPHSRWYTPTAVMHAYQEFLLATGTTGFLNYLMPYEQPPEHEPAYVEKVARSLGHYGAVREFFERGKEERGVTVVDPPYSFEWRTLSEDAGKVQHSVKKGTEGQRWMCRLGIPQAYGDTTGPVVFVGTYGAGLGDAELEGLLGRGALMDASAARWLMSRAVDVGMETLEPMGKQMLEEFTDVEFAGRFAGNQVRLYASGAVSLYRCRTKPGARVISEFTNGSGKERDPAVVVYEDARGRRFCVLCSDVWGPRHDDGGCQLHVNYARQEQVQRCLAWVGRKPLAVTVPEQPDVHVMCRVDGKGRMIIGVQNLHMDALDEMVLRLDGTTAVKGPIEVLEPQAAKAVRTRSYRYTREGGFGYLRLKRGLGSMEMMGIAIGGRGSAQRTRGGRAKKSR